MVAAPPTATEATHAEHVQPPKQPPCLLPTPCRWQVRQAAHRGGQAHADGQPLHAAGARVVCAAVLHSQGSGLAVWLLRLLRTSGLPRCSPCMPPPPTSPRPLMPRPAAQLADALNIPTGPPRQRYYPQCTSCMQKQSAAIRNDKVGGAQTRWEVGRGRAGVECATRLVARWQGAWLLLPCALHAGLSLPPSLRPMQTVLVFHAVLHHGGRSQAWHYAGAMLGMRHYSSSSSSGGGNGRASAGRRR